MISISYVSFELFVPVHTDKSKKLMLLLEVEMKDREDLIEGELYKSKVFLIDFRNQDLEIVICFSLNRIEPIHFLNKCMKEKH